MSFNDHEAYFVTKNKQLLLMLIVSLLFSGVSSFMLVTKERYFVFSSGEFFKERVLVEQVCLESFKSIVSDNPNSQLVSGEILELLEKSPFLLDISDVLKLKSLESGKCQIIVKSKKRLHSFLIEMVESDDFPFFYKLKAIDELILKKGEV
jgi:hypothetical protein